MGRYVLAAVVVVALALPPLIGSDFAYTIGISVATFAVLSTGFNLVFGYAGLLSFAQVTFLGIGGYAAGILVTAQGWSFWPASLVGCVLATCFGLLLGYSSLRLSRHSFGIATLVASLLCMIVARDWIDLTRGPMGIPGLPAPRLDLPGLDVIVFDRPSRFYYLMAAYAVAALAIFHRVVHSRIGRALRAVKLDEPLALSHGVDALSYRLLALGLSAFLTGGAGALFVFNLTIVDPSIFDFYYTEHMLIMVIVGGAGHFWTVLVSSAIFTLVPEYLRFANDLRLVFYGAALMAAMFAFPAGIAGLMRRREVRRWRARINAERAGGAP